MNANDIMRKYSMGLDDVLNVRAIYGGTVSPLCPMNFWMNPWTIRHRRFPQSTPTQVY